MLLHNFNRNVAIAVIFPSGKNLYTLQELRYNYKPKTINEYRYQVQWLSTDDCAEKEWYLSLNQNIGCSFWPGETSAGKRAPKSRDIWKSPGCIPGARFALGRLHRFQVCSKLNFMIGKSSAAVADGE